MATITFHDALGTNGTVNTRFDWANLMLVGGASAVLTDPDGMQIELLGSGFMYGQASPSWTIAQGTVTDLTVKDNLGTVLFTVTGADADAAWLYNWIVGGVDLNNDVGGGPGRLWGTNNTVHGSISAEDILTGSGDDLIFGGRGADSVNSSGGDDTVTGGRGGDEFVEIWGGSLTVTDFHDIGPRGTQDVIRMTRWEYRHMTVTQDGPDTVLTIRADSDHTSTHVITLLDYDMTGLDRSDFVFGF